MNFKFNNCSLSSVPRSLFPISCLTYYEEIIWNNYIFLAIATSVSDWI
ncbi:hypothetical protein IQ238_21515 [Pleurocapsales cyanobacterium LEGE 06147]|nr:hypothetical protein [Pleurocapsales cyanobacterium LEGE 06147]